MSSAASIFHSISGWMYPTRIALIMVVVIEERFEAKDADIATAVGVAAASMFLGKRSPGGRNFASLHRIG